MNRKTVLAVIKKYNMLKQGDTVVIGLSGGADSVSLMHMFLQLENEFELTLICAHINHGIRGDEAKRDEEFCRELCEKNKIDFRVLHADVPKAAKESAMSCEEYGRKIRYEFFSEIAGEQGKIATAHNLNDCAETLIFNLVRGTHSRGACSIPAVRGNIIRPLIETTRDEIEDYCKKNSLEYVIDSTNKENDYSRNKIRNIVLPTLEEINPSAVNAIERYIQAVKQDDETLCEIANEKYELCKTEKGICLKQLIKFPKSIQNRIIFRFLNENTTADISAKNVEDVISITLKNNKRINLSNGLTLKSENGELFVTDENTKPVSFCTSVNSMNGQTEYPYGFISFEPIKDLQFLNKEDIDNCINCDKISNTLVLRSRKNGDKITLKRRNVTKSLKKLFNEDNIPVADRDKTAVLSDSEDNVIWVQGYGVSKEFAADKTSGNIMKIKIKGIR